MTGSDLRSAEIAVSARSLTGLSNGYLVWRLLVKQRKYRQIDGEIVYYLTLLSISLAGSCAAPRGSVSGDGGAWVRSGWLDAR